MLDAASKLTARPQLVVLDLAGTTVEDHDHVAAAFSTALATLAITPTAEQLKSVRGASKREALRRFIPHARPGVAERLYDTFRDDLARRYRDRGVRAIAGAEQTIDALRQSGIAVALNTGFDREITQLLISTLGWHARVDTVVCGDDVPAGRPAPYLIERAMAVTGIAASGAVANVGDTVLDLEAGHRAGVGWNIAVLSGAHDKARLSLAPHTHIIESVAHLTHLWQPF